MPNTLDERKTQFPQAKSVAEADKKRMNAYKEKHGETVTKEDYEKYKESFKAPVANYDLVKPLSFSDYKNIAGFYGKAVAKMLI